MNAHVLTQCINRRAIRQFMGVFDRGFPEMKHPGYLDGIGVPLYLLDIGIIQDSAFIKAAVWWFDQRGKIPDPVDFVECLC